MLEKRDLALIRLGVRRQWLTPEEGEDCLFLKRRFQTKYTIEEIIRRRAYLDEEAIRELVASASTIEGRQRPSPPRRTAVQGAVPVAAPPRGARDLRRPVKAASTSERPASQPSVHRPLAKEDPAAARTLLDFPVNQLALPEILPDPKMPFAELDRSTVEESEEPTPFLAQVPSEKRQEVRARRPTALEDDPPSWLDIKDPKKGPRESPRAPPLVFEERTERGLEHVPNRAGEQAKKRTSLPRDNSSLIEDLVLERRQTEEVEAEPAKSDPSSAARPVSPKVELGTPRLESALATTAASRPRTKDQPNETSPNLPPSMAPGQVIVDSAEHTVLRFPKRISDSVLKGGHTVRTIPRIQATKQSQSSVRDDSLALLGSTFGRYQVERMIARGKTSSVFFAKPIAGGAGVALKIFDSSAIRTQARSERLHRDLAELSAVEAATLVRVLDVGEEGGRHFVVMEYVEGWTLSERLEAQGSFDRAVALGLVHDVASALAEVHARGLLHGGVSLDKVLVREDGRAILCGFGLPAMDRQDEAAAEGRRADLLELGRILVSLIDPGGTEALGGKAELLSAALSAPAEAGDAQLVLAVLDRLRAGMVGVAPPSNVDRPPSRLLVLLRSQLVVSLAVALLLGAPRLAGRFGIPELDAPALLRQSAWLGTVGLGLAAALLAALGLVRRGQLPLPGSTTWLVTLKDAAGVVGAAVLVLGLVLGPPALFHRLVSGGAIVVLASWVYGIFLRRHIARRRADRGVGHMLGVLADPALRSWRQLHAPLLASLTCLSLARVALMAYFRARGLS